MPRRARANPFIDLEAGVGGSSDEDEVVDEVEDDEDNGAWSISPHYLST